MAETKVKAPDGSVITVRHPEGATKAEIIAYAQENYRPVKPAALPDVSLEQPIVETESVPRPSAMENYLSRSEFTPPTLEPSDYTGMLDAAGSVVTNVTGEVLGGVAAAGSAPFVGVDRAVEIMDSIRDAVGTDPFTEKGKEKLKHLGQFFEMTGVPQGLSATEKYLGDTAFEGAGGDSEFAAMSGAAAKSLPTAMLEMLGLAGLFTIRGTRKVTGVPDKVVEKLEAEGKSVDNLSSAEIEQIHQDVVTLLDDQNTRVELFEEMGITPTRAQATQDVTDFMEQEELAKQSTRTRAALDKQDIQLNEKIAEQRDATGGELQPESTVSNAIIDRATILDEQISDLYQKAREAAPDVKNVRFDSLTQTLRKLRGDNVNIVSAVRTRLGDMGLIDPKTYKPRGRISVEQAEEVRKFLNEQWTPENAYAIREMKDALDGDVFRVAGDDVFKEARQAKAEYEAGLDRAKVSKFDSRKTNLVRDILENKVDPDEIVDRVVFRKGYRADDLRQLKNYLVQDDAGKAAWDDLRAETLERIRDRSFIGREGDLALSDVQLEKQLKAMGAKKMEVLFSPEERLFLKRLLDVAQARRPKRKTGTGRGPSAQSVLGLLDRMTPTFKRYFDGLAFDAADRKAITLPSPDQLTVQTKVGPAAATVGGTTGVSGSERRRLQRQRSQPEYK